MHTVAWHQICRPKSRGCTGVKNLYYMNRAMIAKLTWRLLCDEDTLWIKILKAKYGDPCQENLLRKPCSSTWRSILAIIPVLYAGLSQPKDSTFTEAGGPHNWSWLGTSSGNFTVSSAYEMQLAIPDDAESTKWQNIWSLKGPQRNNLLLWQARLDRMPMSSLLFRRGLRDTPRCDICDHDVDNGLHALRDCTWARSVWRKLLPMSSWNRFFHSTTDLRTWIDRNLTEDIVGGHCYNRVF